MSEIAQGVIYFSQPYVFTLLSMGLSTKAIGMISSFAWYVAIFEPQPATSLWSEQGVCSGDGRKSSAVKTNGTSALFPRHCRGSVWTCPGDSVLPSVQRSPLCETD